MRDSISSIIERVFTNRVGHLLVVLNLCLIAFEYSRSPAREHGLENCFTVGSALYNNLLPAWLSISRYLNLPAFFLTELVAMPVDLSFPDMCLQTASQIRLPVFIVLGSIQWMLVGYGVEKSLRRRV